MPLILSGSAGLSGNVGNVTKDMLPAGSVLQVVHVPKTDIFSFTNTSFIDVPGLVASITPRYASSKILVSCNVSLGATAGSFAVFPRLARNGSGIFLSDLVGSRIQAAAMYEMGAANTTPVSLTYLDSPNTTDAVTYSLQVRVNSNTGRVNGSAGDSDVSNWSRSVSSLTLMEVKS